MRAGSDLCHVHGADWKELNPTHAVSSVSSQHLGAARPCGRVVIFHPEPWVTQAKPSDEAGRGC